jgi:hypothetical protein
MPTGIPKGKRKLTDEERKARKKALAQTPEAKARAKKNRDKPENKARRKAYDQTPEAKARAKELAKTPEAKAKLKARLARPEVIARRKALNQSPEYKAKQKARENSPEYKARRKEINSRPENVARQQEYASRHEVKERKKEYMKSERGQAALKKYYSGNKAKALKESNELKRLTILQEYSKRLSNSNIPCCNCCGENSHIDFLEIDHIAGKKEMDSEPELVKLGYSSKLKSIKWFNWLIENNFPKGFQILCKNCNQAKAFLKNKNQCPHEIMRKEEAFARMDEQSSFEAGF